MGSLRVLLQGLLFSSLSRQSKSISGSPRGGEKISFSPDILSDFERARVRILESKLLEKLRKSPNESVVITLSKLDLDLELLFQLI